MGRDKGLVGREDFGRKKTNTNSELSAKGDLEELFPSQL